MLTLLGQGPTSSNEIHMRTDPTKRPPRAGRRPRYTPDDVVNAAVACVAAEGLDALTVRSVATELGSSPMALYRHVENRDDLVARVVDEVLGKVSLEADPTTRTGQYEWLKSMCRSLYEVLIEHPGVAEHLMTLGPTGPKGFLFMDRICAVLLASGLKPPAAADAYTFLMVTASGFCARSSRIRMFAASRDIEPAMTKALFAERVSEQQSHMPALDIVGPAFRTDGLETYELALSAVIESFLAPEPS